MRAALPCVRGKLKSRLWKDGRGETTSFRAYIHVHCLLHTRREVSGICCVCETSVERFDQVLLVSEFAPSRIN